MGQSTKQEVPGLCGPKTQPNKITSQKILVSFESQRELGGCPNPYINLGPWCSIKLKMSKYQELISVLIWENMIKCTFE